MMNYDPKIHVVGSGKHYHKGLVQLSQIFRLEHPQWLGPVKNGWRQKLVQMDKDYYWRIDIRISPRPSKDPYGFDPNYQAIILTLTEARQWLIREGYDIPDDLTKLLNAQPPEASEQKKDGKPKSQPPKKQQNKIRDIKKRFSFRQAQARFDGQDLELPTGADLKPVEILKKLVESFGETVLYKKLDKNSNDTADSLKGKIHVIRVALKKKKAPCKIVSKKWEGYVLTTL